MFKRWQFWLGLLISAVFLYLALRGLDLPEVWQHVRNAEYWWLVPGVAIYFFGVWARTWRWHYMLRALKVVSLRRLFPIVCIGYMGNNIYPARIGELLRAYVLRRKEGVSISASLATILVERIFDGVIMLLFVFVGLPLAPSIPATGGISSSSSACSFSAPSASFLSLPPRPAAQRPCLTGSSTAWCQPAFASRCAALPIASWADSISCAAGATWP